jgi:nondiscriminating glutamyl-tRNA synthetase
MSVRVRFAPSPTGPLHLGNARIAVINHLFARKEHGRFILRIEDTDEARFDPGSEALIIRELEWLGIRPDEGPDVGGTVGPYRQSERREIYARIAERFLAERLAYRCFCTDEMLAEEKRLAAASGKPPRYSGRCRSLTDREIASRTGLPHTLRFRADFTEIRIRDMIHREITFPSDAFGDFIIVRADGSPVFIFSSAVDDCLMGITHVIRGEDHLPNTPRQILIHRALGNALPTFAHVPLLVTGSGDKIKKREGGFDLETLAGEGYLPEGVVAYLASVGNPGATGKEAATPRLLAESFDIARLGRSAVKIEPEKVKRMSGLAARSMPADDLASRMAPFLSAAGYDTERIGRDTLVPFADAIRENIETLTDAALYAPIFFADRPPLAEACRSLLAEESSRTVLSAFLGHIRTVPELTAGAYRAAIGAVSRETGFMGKDLYMPIRAAVTGMEHGPALEGMFALLGRDKVVDRVQMALSDGAR